MGSITRLALVLLLLVATGGAGSAVAFDYGPVVMTPPRTLFVNAPTIGTGGSVTINGVDTAPLSGPFQWNWGDGSSNSGWFPQGHTYANTSKNYVVSVTSFHQDGTTQQASTVVFFVAASVSLWPPPTTPNSVDIPSQPITLQSHYTYSPPADVGPLPDSVFTTYSRSAMTHVLRWLASHDQDIVNDDVFLTNGTFAQVILQNASFGGGISFWFTSPMAAGFGPGIVATPTQWPILFNEMGKNVALNTPRTLPYGGNTDGNASEIYSETMGNILSYAAGYKLVNVAATNPGNGLGSDAATDIGNSLLNGAANLRQQYEAYVAAGAPFSSWNPYDGSPDPTLGTVAALAYKFIEHAEAQGKGHLLPAKRMLRCLQTFDASMLAKYDPLHNTPAGATYRSTLMVKALSYAFDEDLRSEFRALNFPIDDNDFAAICNGATAFAPGSTPIGSAANATPTIVTTLPVTCPAAGAVQVSGSGESAALSTSAGTAFIGLAYSIARDSFGTDNTNVVQSSALAVFNGDANRDFLNVQRVDSCTPGLTYSYRLTVYRTTPETGAASFVWNGRLTASAPYSSPSAGLAVGSRSIDSAANATPTIISTLSLACPATGAVLVAGSGESAALSSSAGTAFIGLAYSIARDSTTTDNTNVVQSSALAVFNGDANRDFLNVQRVDSCTPGLTSTYRLTAYRTTADTTAASFVWNGRLTASQPLSSPAAGLAAGSTLIGSATNATPTIVTTLPVTCPASGAVLVTGSGESTAMSTNAGTAFIGLAYSIARDSTATDNGNVVQSSALAVFNGDANRDFLNVQRVDTCSPGATSTYRLTAYRTTPDTGAGSFVWNGRLAAVALP